LYGASKFALEALAEAYRHELALQGIECAIVEPGRLIACLSIDLPGSRQPDFLAASRLPRLIASI